MSLDFENNESFPESLIVEVFAEIDKATVQQRWCEVNVLLRLSILSGLQMQLDATLNMLCGFVGEIANFDLGMVYFWDDESHKMQLRITRNLGNLENETYDRGSTLNLWATQCSRPLMISRGVNEHADAALYGAKSEGRNRVMLYRDFRKEQRQVS